MGYTKTIEYRGLTVPSAYHRIDTTSSANGVCMASVNAYTSRQAFMDGEGYLTQEMVTYPISYGTGSGADKNQGYDYLLNLPENTDAVPVFEGSQPD